MSAETAQVQGSVGQTVPDAKAEEGGTKEANTTLTAKSAVEIFVAKHSHTSRDALSCKLAVDYGITSKSVRGIFILTCAACTPFEALAERPTCYCFANST